jgi:hypothetical protein
MHASIWKFTGDPDDLLARHDAMLAEAPTDEFIAYLCLRAPDGIVCVDTCPSREAFEAFASSDWFRELRHRHGLGDPTEVSDYPVHAAIIVGEDRAAVAPA